MERSSAFDGGRVLKAGLIALGPLLFAAPALAQPGDPLAPLPTATVTVPPQGAQSGVATSGTFPSPVTTKQIPPPTLLPITAVPAPQTPPPVAIVAVPKDWRGVLDAIDAGNWASAQAGIAALPPGVLTPYAKAELYTAKGSPFVDLASLEALIAGAPELPQANQLALMAIKRGATNPPLIMAERATVNLGSAPVRYRARPVQGE